MQLVIISGLSGAGKTVALKQYEDLGYYCIDNLPLALVSHMATRTLHTMEKRYERLAVGIDARESPKEIARFPKYLDKLRERGIEIRVLFLLADEQVLLQRYSDTRRKHPLSDAKTPLREAIRKEVQLLEPISNAADATIDTSALNLHELREKVLAQTPGSASGQLSIQLMSFGFKHGPPREADLVFDVRFLPNPHYVPDLKPKTGLDPEVVAYVAREGKLAEFYALLEPLLDFLIPQYEEEGKAHLSVAIGCTGGRHRSVAITEHLGHRFAERDDVVVEIEHRDVGRRA